MIAVLIVAVAVAAAIASAVVLLDHASDDVYAIPGWGVALTLGLLALSLGGGGLSAWSRAPAFSAVLLAAGALGVFGLLTFFVGGFLAMLAAALLIARTLARPGPDHRRIAAAAGGLLAGAPVPLLVIFALGGPVVQCHRGGSSAEENIFMGLASTGKGTVTSSSGASTATPGGRETGHGESGGYAYSYACAGGRLVRFRLRWR